jgi:hypothetical protein
MREACAREVEDLHRFFEEWLRGELAPPDFERCERAMAEGFELVRPDGVTLARDELLARLRAASGSRAGEEPRLRIWTESFRVDELAPGLALARYEEWHDGRDGKRGRMSTALLAEDAGAPRGILWRHVHETWLPRSEGDGAVRW